MLAQCLNAAGLLLQVLGAGYLLLKARSVRNRIDSMPDWRTFDGTQPFLEALRDSARSGFADQALGFAFFLAGTVLQLVALFLPNA